MNSKINFFFLMLFSFSLLLVSCSDDDDIVNPQPQTIADIASADAQFSTLVGALDRVGLVNVVATSQNLTVFAPTNSAFEALGVDLSTISDQDLTEILLYHVLGEEVRSTDIDQGRSYESTASTNGPNSTALSIMIDKSGSGVTINNTASVIQADIEASNGVIHVIDNVITPLDIVGFAVSNPDFSTLVSALSTAPGDLVDVLSSEGPFTVFAPVNSAFEDIAEVVASLSNDQITSVLTYHVIPNANVRSSDLQDNMMVGTVNGDEFMINLGEKVTITDTQGNVAEVVLTDVQATNGIVHVIDKVIIPQL